VPKLIGARGRARAQQAPAGYRWAHDERAAVRPRRVERARDRPGDRHALHALQHVTSILLAFASGALIAALAFELFEEAFELGGAVRSGLGLLAGAAVFVAVDTMLDRRVAGDGGLDGPEVVAQGARGGVGWALLAEPASPAGSSGVTSLVTVT